MNIFQLEPLASRVEFDETSMWVHLVDGRRLAVPLAFFPRLLNASAEARANFIISGGGRGIHWEELDEDISVEGLLLGIGDLTAQRGRKVAG